MKQVKATIVILPDSGKLALDGLFIEVAPSRVHVFLWECDRGTRLLQELLLTDYGIDVGAWALNQAFGISADGTTIVGSGENPEGAQEAWVVRLPKPHGCKSE